MNDARRVPLALEPPPSKLPRRIGFHAIRWLPLALLAAVTYVLYPDTGSTQAPLMEVGEVAQADVVAPFAFYVPKSPAEIQREADALAATVRPIYEFQPEAVDSVRATAVALFDALDATETDSTLADSAAAYGLRLSTEEAAFLFEGSRRAAYRSAALRMIDRELARGIVANATIDSETAREIIERRGETERVVARDAVLSLSTFLDRRSARHPEPNSVLGDQLHVRLLNTLFRPTLVPNTIETEALRAELRADVDSLKGLVRQNERIIGEHEVVTAAVQERLAALLNELSRRGGTGGVTLTGAIGKILTNALILSIFWLLLMLYRRETYGNARQMTMVGVLFGIVVLGAAAMVRLSAPAPELIPIPLAAMLIAIFFSGRVAMVAATVLAVLLASQHVYVTQAYYGDEAALYLALIGGVAAAVGIRAMRRRAQMLATMLIVAAAFAVAAIAIGLAADYEIARIGLTIMRGGGNAVVSAALASVALPVLENVSRLTTDLTLLELSNPTHPLVRRLATEAPGTYAHTIAVANLCEAGCNAIGANGLLARVGCYYHDIGKIKKPQFFVENQSGGTNPHDKLKPDVSATIIRNHVKEGMALADEAGLPDIVKAFIPEHHGTAEITYFLERARDRGDEPPADHYRYPGPKPRSVETAVAMLADGVEAALRVLNDPSPQDIREAIDHIVGQRVATGQLNDAPLTLAQLDRVKEEFSRVVSGVHHNRIDYPVRAGGIAAEWKPAARA